MNQLIKEIERPHIRSTQPTILSIAFTLLDPFSWKETKAYSNDAWWLRLFGITAGNMRRIRRLTWRYYSLYLNNHKRVFIKDALDKVFGE